MFPFNLLLRSPKIVGLASVLTGTSSYLYYYRQEAQENIRYTNECQKRIYRTAMALKDILKIYKKLEKNDQLEITDVHTKAANRLLELFRANGGVYIKFGQHLAALEYLIPKEYCDTMVVLQNEAPGSTEEQVKQVFREEFSSEISEVYSQFDFEPVGTASLAQVHRAVTLNGEQVAVKIQHSWLDLYSAIDIATASVAVKIVKWAFPSFQFEWLADEMRCNLPNELDFVKEAMNAERVAHNFKDDPFLVVPKVHWKWTSRRILTMEYIEGKKITDKEFLDRYGISKTKVSNKLAQVFSRMIFEHGFLHCDPHPGNTFITVKENTQNWIYRLLGWKNYTWQLVLLDHGLYRELSSDFQMDYAQLWLALIFADQEKIKEYSMLLGGGDSYKLFSSILTKRSWEGVINGVSRKKTSNEDEMIRDKISTYLVDIADILSRMPRQLLLVLKTNDLLKSVERILETGEYMESYFIIGGYCIDRVGIGYPNWYEREVWITKTRIKLLLMKYLIQFAILISRISS